MEPRVKTNSPPSRKTRPVKRGFGFTLGLTDAPVGTVHRTILSGLPARGVTDLQAATDLPLHQLLDVIRLPASTFARRKRAGKLSPDESERVYRLAGVFESAIRLFEGDVPAAREWLTRPCRGLGGATPIELTKTEVGARAVEDLIGRLEHGVFA
jgi:putative toxin-antitoxin system antitoxin component (TIGR02293 family)